jgi:ubiquinone/menaquinone biosynthesis C-methylase UbiE
MNNILDGFSGVDRPEHVFEFLDSLDDVDVVQKIKRRMIEISLVGKRQTILDVGCGLGQEAMRIADLVGPDGSVTGIDIADTFVAEASRRAEIADVNVEFQVGSALDLPFPDGTFDVSRAERVLLLLDEPLAALQEMARVVRPGGQVVVFDFDLTTRFVDSDDERLTRQIEKFLADQWPNGLIGRRLPHYFRKIGLVDVVIEPHVVTANFEMFKRLYYGVLVDGLEQAKIEKDEFAKWWAGLEAMEASGCFFSSRCGFVVCGRKP